MNEFYGFVIEKAECAIVDRDRRIVFLNFTICRDDSYARGICKSHA